MKKFAEYTRKTAKIGKNKRKALFHDLEEERKWREIKKITAHKVYRTLLSFGVIFASFCLFCVFHVLIVLVEHKKLNNATHHLKHVYIVYTIYIYANNNIIYLNLKWRFKQETWFYYNFSTLFCCCCWDMMVVVMAPFFVQSFPLSLFVCERLFCLISFNFILFLMIFLLLLVLFFIFSLCPLNRCFIFYVLFSNSHFMGILCLFLFSCSCKACLPTSIMRWCSFFIH